jgi:hypothetical protein
MQRRRAAHAVVGALVATVLCVPAAAHAGSLSHDDPAGDAQKITESPTGTTVTAAPANTTGDIVHLGVRYGLVRMKEKVRLRAMARHWFLSSRIATAHRHFDLVLHHDPGSNQVTLTRGRTQTPIVCDGLVPEVDRAHHTVAITVPADCLFTPAWVEVGVGVVARGKATGISFGDDALRRRGITEAHLTLSRKIRQN